MRPDRSMDRRGGVDEPALRLSDSAQERKHRMLVELQGTMVALRRRRKIRRSAVALAAPLLLAAAATWLLSDRSDEPSGLSDRGPVPGDASEPSPLPRVPGQVAHDDTRADEAAIMVNARLRIVPAGSGPPASVETLTDEQLISILSQAEGSYGFVRSGRRAIVMRNDREEDRSEPDAATEQTGESSSEAPTAEITA